jgi:diadenylate cyclase
MASKTKKTQSSATQSSPIPTNERTSTTLLQCVANVAQECGASAILVYKDALGKSFRQLPPGLSQRVYYVTRRLKEESDRANDDEAVIHVPAVPLTRMGQVKIAVLLALSRGILTSDDVIVCLSGLAGSGALDTLVVLEVGKEFEMFLAPREGEGMASHVLPEVLERVIDIATALSSQGREGKPVGALFVLGDTERVLSLVRQLILNPFRGYPEEQRNVLDPALEETIKELATIDGAFVVRGDGVVESAGAYLRTAEPDEFELPRGLGARHHAAAAITAVSEAVAVTISESTGTVTIFKNGRIVTEIEKPRTIGLGRRL